MARRITGAGKAQAQGHTVTLLPPAYVRPYVRPSKTDRADAAALLEAVRSGQVPRVPVTRVEQQALVALHRIRAQWVTTRTARVNAQRGLLRGGERTRTARLGRLAL